MAVQDLEKALDKTPQGFVEACGQYAGRMLQQYRIFDFPVKAGEITIKLVYDYLRQPPGLRTLLTHLLLAEPKPASPLKSYYKAGFFGDSTQKIKPEDLYEFRGYLYKTPQGEWRPIKFDQVEIDDREDSVICEACGGKFPAGYCGKPVEVMRNGSPPRVETWCNHCRQNSEDPVVRATGTLDGCIKCEKVICEFHPKHGVSPAARGVVVPLLQAAGGSNIPPNIPLPDGWIR